jgi:putative tricarboxylic transport membrane protein
MRRPYQIAGSFLLILAAFVAIEALALRYYTNLGPGPGFFPFWLALCLGGLALAMIVQASLGSPEPRPADFFADRAGYLCMGAVVLALVGTTALLDILGFRLTMFAVYVFLLCALGRQGFFLTFGIALAGSVGVYHIFVHWLKVPLPTGSFGF